MENTTILERSIRHERERIQFLERDRGEAEARDFARRTLVSYRKAVVYRSAPAGDSTFRIRLIGCYCYFKRYLHDSQPGSGS